MKRLNTKVKTFFNNFFRPLKKIKWAKLKVIWDNAFFHKLFCKRSAKYWVYIIILISLIQVGFGIAIYGFRSESPSVLTASKIIPFPVAVVNQDFVTYDQYLQEKTYIHHFYESTQQEKIDLKEIDKEVLTHLIETKIIASQARIYDVSVTPEELDVAIKDIVDQNGGEEKVGKVLDELYGLTLNQFKTLVKNQLLRDKVANSAIEKVTARHILIRTDKDAPAEKIEEARVKLEGIMNEIKNGLDFAEAAKKYSEDTGSAEQGGALDPFTRGDMVEEFSKAAFETKVGELSGLVKTEFGWHLIKVEKKEGKIQKPFVEWLSDLRDRGVVLRFI